jgi:hypothetical protein
MRHSTWIMLTGVVFAAGVSAQPTVKANGPSTTADPNERICEEVILTGSRLGAKRFCATRAEWEDKKRQDREAIEKAQVGPCMITTTGATGRPSC